MNVVVLGGSAQSTPALFDSEFALDAARFSFVLAGRSAGRLAAVERASRCIAAERGSALDCRLTTDAADVAVAGADVVVVQFRIGGYAARTGDETFPHRYGVCGDEGLGPGGLANAWRTWPELARLLEAVRRSSPRALVVLLTSPIGILTRCARDAFPDLRVVGICELPWTTLRELCGSARAAAAAQYAYIAVNHLGWFSDLRSGGRSIVGGDGVRPLKYVRLHAAGAEVLAEQLAATPRGIELARLADDAFAVYESGSAADVCAAVRRRQTPWYAHALAPLLRSLAGDQTGITYFLTARNAGYCNRFGADELIEMPFVARGGVLERVATRAWQRDDIAHSLAQLISYERCAADAVRTRDAGQLAPALALHPWLAGAAISDQLVADVIAAPVPALATSSR